MIKVINVISDTNIGGAGKCVVNFCKNYNQEKFEIVVVLPKGSALIEELKGTSARLIEIDALKDKSFDIKALFKLIKIFRAEKPDIVHTHASSIARIAAKFAKDSKIIYTRHCAFPVSDKIKKGIGRFIYKHTNELFSDRIIAVGGAAKENLLEGGIDPDRIETFLNGVEKVEKISEEKKREIRERYKIKDDEVVIGIIARIEEVKGHDTFIDAAKILLNEKNINAKFLILGTGTKEEELKEKVKQLKLEDKIIFTGFVKDVGSYLNIFDIQVNCSFGTETSSLSLLEGMSIGVPAVVSNYGGNPYLISDGENGYIVPIKSPSETAEAIYKILVKPEIRKYMQKRSVEIFDENFTIETYVNNIQNVYETVEREHKMKKINVLDIFIILMVFLIILVGYNFVKSTDNTVIDSTEKVIYQVKTNQSIKQLYDYIEVGANVYDGQKNFYIGKIIDKGYKNTLMYGTNDKNGQYVETTLEDYIDITLTIESNAEYSESNISVGDLDVKIGKNVYLKGKGFATQGYIVSIER